MVIEDSSHNEFVWIPSTKSEYVKDLTFMGVTPLGDDTLPTGITNESADVIEYG